MERVLLLRSYTIAAEAAICQGMKAYLLCYAGVIFAAESVLLDGRRDCQNVNGFVDFQKAKTQF